MSIEMDEAGRAVVPASESGQVTERDLFWGMVELTPRFIDQGKGPALAAGSAWSAVQKMVECLRKPPARDQRGMHMRKPDREEVAE